MRGSYPMELPHRNVPSVEQRQRPLRPSIYPPHTIFRRQSFSTTFLLLDANHKVSISSFEFLKEKKTLIHLTANDVWDNTYLRPRDPLRVSTMSVHPRRDVH